MSTSANSESLSFEIAGTGETVTLSDFFGVVAGYTGRDAAAVQHHIDELAAIGIAPPPEVPMFYPVTADRFSSAATHPASANLTSGEIEPLYVRHNGRYYLGIASDHTDRDLEAEDIGKSKQACPKPVSAAVIPVESIDALSLDDCTARAWVDGVLYQDGSLDGILRPKDVVGMLQERTDVGDGDFVCLGGTLPLLDGTFVGGAEWRLELSFPDGTTLEHTYTMSEA